MYKTSCRGCGSTKLKKILDLGEQPLANSFTKEPNNLPKYPLELMVCEDCNLTLLSYVVPPEEMFSSYLYTSSTSETQKKHWKTYAEEVFEPFAHFNKVDVLEIASNDGYLLKQFQELGANVVGVDPAVNLALQATADGIPTIRGYWGEQTFKVLKEDYFPDGCDIICANNVLAHVDDVNSFAKYIKKALKPHGIATIEAPWAYNFFKNVEFDTTYHEHLSYFLIKPLQKLFRNNDLMVYHIEEQEIHGGSIRLYITHYSSEITPSGNYFKLVDMEQEYYSMSSYDDFKGKVEKIRDDFWGLMYKIENSNLMNKMIGSGKINSDRLCAYGAAAKGNTLLNYLGYVDVSLLIDFIVDENLLKQGLYTPGTNIPVVDINTLKDFKGYCLITAWNFKEEIMKKVKTISPDIKFIIPIPEMEVV